MTKLLVDVDDAMLEAAQRVLGTRSKKDTVNAALARLVAEQGERLRLAIDQLAALNDDEPVIDRSDAW